MITKKIIIIFVLLILAGVSFAFRGRISQPLSFSHKAPITEPQLQPQPPLSSSTPSIPTVKKEGSKQSVISPVSPPTSFTLLPYKGRNPEEVRPVHEEVKLFSDEQKNNIYKGIENNGQAVKKNPDFFFGWIQIGLLKKTIGDYEGARDSWEYAGIIRPKNSVSFGNLGELYWRYLPNFPKSEENFKISIKNKPNDDSTYIAFSGLYEYSYKEKKNLADAVLLDGLKANPDNVNLEKALAAFYERNKEFVKAIEWWRKVLATEPTNTAVAASIEALKGKVEQ